jgi:hypothetical protein
MSRPNEFGFTAEAPNEDETERMAIAGDGDTAVENHGAAIDETVASETPQTLKRRGEKVASTDSRKEVAVRNASALCSSEGKKDT